MSKRLHQTILALSLGMLGMGAAQAQLVVDEGQSPSSPSPSSATAVSVSSSPQSGLLIVDGYDTPPPPPPVVVVVKRPLPAPVTVVVKQPSPVVVMADKAPKVKIVSSAPDATGVLEVGHRPATISSPKGWADNVPLSIALHQVVPSDYVVRTEGLSATQKVSWSGDRPWNTVLETIARTGHLNIAILWASKTVTVVPGNRPGLTVLPPAPVVRVMPVQAPVLHIQPAAPMVQSWTLDPTKSLRENVEAWVKKAGWNKLVWDGADYPVVAPATFTGVFDAPDGPLSQLIEGYAQSDQPLLVKLTTMDRVVHVSNKNYHPAEVQAISGAELAPDILYQSGVSQSAVSPATTSETIQDGSKLAPITINDHTSHH